MKTSAGILAFRVTNEVEVFLVHPGGPFFKNKDEGVWSIPKGEYTGNEEAFLAAKREFLEETGHELQGTFFELETVKQKGGKEVKAWAIEQEIDTSRFVSNTFNVEWPPRSGRFQTFREVDKAEWFTLPVAKLKINIAQAAFLDQLATHLSGRLPVSNVVG